MRNSSIAVFDSGIGGLALLRAIHELLPQEQLIYLADTANFPYGTKTQRQVYALVAQILQYFVNNWQPKAILIACNTASAIRQLRPSLTGGLGSTLVYDMIQPTVDYVRNNYSNYQHIGIIATPNTINSQLYQRGLATNSFSPKVHTLATPKLAAVIESSHASELHSTIHHYLDDPILASIQALLLACTHYAWVKPEIHAYYQKHQRQVAIIDPINVVAQKLKQDLALHNLTRKAAPDSDEKSSSQAKLKEANRFITTSDAPNFAEKILSIMPPNYPFELKQISLNP